MIFLIHYHRNTSTLLGCTSFAADEHKKANATRLALEIKLINETDEHEVVTLEANSLADLHKTHQRYFYTLEEILSPSKHLFALPNGPSKQTAIH
jgi:hypothetical protein